MFAQSAFQQILEMASPVSGLRFARLALAQRRALGPGVSKQPLEPKPVAVASVDLILERIPLGLNPFVIRSQAVKVLLGFDQPSGEPFEFFRVRRGRRWGRGLFGVCGGTFASRPPAGFLSVILAVLLAIPIVDPD